jgi:uncharacterized membrane protein YjgN (DUF898 family)
MATKRVAIKYTGKGTDILGWYILSAILITITLGIYTPWAVNSLYRYIIEHTEVEIPD